MSDGPFRGAFPHQHGDPRSLVERITAQLRERIQEAIEMAGLELMVERRRHHGRPAPETSSATDRAEFEDTARGLLSHLRATFHAELSADDRAALERAEAAAEETQAALDGQVWLARRLPDYWQRFDAHRADYVRARIDPPPSRPGWLARIFGG